MSHFLHLNKFFLRCLLLFWFVLLRFLSFGQLANSEALVRKFAEYNQQTHQEKVFVHTDRSSYVAGEIIWFKVYCADGMSGALSNLSKVAYIEVLDKDLQSILQAKIALKDGTGSGSIIIPQAIRSGNFIVRAYTNWMKNFDPEFYFHQNLTIVNTLKAEAVAASLATDQFYDAQFFPEGGNLVNELQSKVAFRVTDKSGKGITFNGAVIDEKNDTLLRFRPAKFGIGHFTFTPHKGKQYKAVIRAENGTVISSSLPGALNTGYVLHVSGSSPTAPIKINIHTNTNDSYAHIIVHGGQQVKASHILNISNGRADFEIDRKNFGDGISAITIFNQNNQPVCERLYFKKPGKQLQLEAVADNSMYPARKKVTINVAAKDEGSNPQVAEMSMAVFLLDSLPFAYKSINSYLWMSSELKGIVESPEYYIENNTTEAIEATDDLMLTHGWRRFRWQDVIESKKPAFKFLPEYEGHIVSGKIVNKYTGAFGKDILSFLSVPGPLFHLYPAKSAADGTINFSTRNFYGSSLVVGQTKKPDADSFRLDFADPFSESYSSVRASVFDISRISSHGLLKRSINMQVQNVYTGEKLNLFHRASIDSTNFYGKPQVTYMLEDYTRFPTMEEVLREYVREINVRKRRDNFTLTTVTKDEYGNAIVKEPVVLLDGVPQFDNGNKISHYDPLKVRKLEVVQDRYYLGTASFDGIASFFTYNGDLEGFRLDTTSTVLDYDGLQAKREFYSPVYETNEQYTSRLPDFRSLLYWSPDIKTSASGNREVTFYTSQLPGKYAVVLQGISKEGRAGSKVFTIDVKD